MSHQKVLRANTQPHIMKHFLYRHKNEKHQIISLYQIRLVIKSTNMGNYWLNIIKISLDVLLILSICTSYTNEKFYIKFTYLSKYLLLFYWFIQFQKMELSIYCYPFCYNSYYLDNIIFLWHFQHYFNYIVVVRCIHQGNWNTWKN